MNIAAEVTVFETTYILCCRYYETPEEDDRELCPGDRCWDNLMYPLSGRYIGMGDSKEYVFAMVCSAIVFFIGYLLVTRPFW